MPQESENYELKHRLRQLEAAYEEEVVQSEATIKELKETINRLDNVHSKLAKVEECLDKSEMAKIQLEKKHEKTCQELKTLKHIHENLEKELTSSKIVIKTLKKAPT